MQGTYRRLWHFNEPFNKSGKTTFPTLNLQLKENVSCLADVDIYSRMNLKGRNSVCKFPLGYRRIIMTYITCFS